MRGVYEASGKISGLAAAETLLYITAPSTAIVEVLETKITNATNETNEQLEACWQKVNALGTPTATTLTPSEYEQGDQAAGSVVKLHVTASEPSYVANTELHREGFASLAGYRNAGEVIIAPSASWGLRLLTTTNTAFDAIVSVKFREKG